MIKRLPSTVARPGSLTILRGFLSVECPVSLVSGINDRLTRLFLFTPLNFPQCMQLNQEIINCSEARALELNIDQLAELVAVRLDHGVGE